MGGLGFLAPALLYVLAIVAWPLVQTVILSFTNASLRKTTDWVGWANMFTEDCNYVERFWGTMHGRTEVLADPGPHVTLAVLVAGELVGVVPSQAPEQAADQHHHLPVRLGHRFAPERRLSDETLVEHAA